MTLDQLKKLKAEGKFHHATYRTDFARGLHIYSVAKPGSGFRGFEYAGCFSETICTKEEIDAAYDIVRNTGVSVGSYGNG